jgi:DNA replication protein DnaC
MSTPQLDRLREHCHQLRLYQVENELTARLEQAAKKELSYADFLDQLLACEVDAKTHQHHQMRIAMARFPFQKTLESFDFKFQPSLDPKQIRDSPLAATSRAAITCYCSVRLGSGRAI